MKSFSVLSIPFALIVLFATPSARGQEKPQGTIRIATFNASLYGKTQGEIADRMADGVDEHVSNIARVVQTIRPDVLLINEIDFDQGARTANLLSRKFFAQSQATEAGIEYPYVYAAASNTGLDSRLDLNNNGRTGEPSDAWGYGTYPGQYAMAIFSRFPIQQGRIRSFQKFLWKDFPNALRPLDPKTESHYYSDEVWNQLRLSSKNHVDVPIKIGDQTIHVLACHPTPPVFDGPEDRNGCRNHDEIAFWSVYLAGADAPLTDDLGHKGGLGTSESFVIMGDLNSDSFDGDGRREAIVNLLNHDRVQDPKPKSKGAVVEASRRGNSKKQKGDPALDTAGFGGNLRVDYVLPSADLQVAGSGVVWPEKGSPIYEAVRTTDHRMVWIDVELQ